MKTKLKTLTATLVTLACRYKWLRLHPKLRWLNYACPVIENIPRARSRPKSHKKPSRHP